MSPVTRPPPPLQLLLGAPGHGVVGYAADLASALARLDDRVLIASCAEVDEAIALARSRSRVHLHVTDRLLGRSPEEAADSLERLAAVTRLTITAHDLPQSSDGTALTRRIAAYTRFFAAAEAVTVNSRHEQRLAAQFLPAAPAPRAVPLGTRVSTALPRPADDPPPPGEAGRDLTVLIAGYVYPGKGHAGAIRAAAEAARALTAAGERVGRARVLALGAPSAGHERDVAALRSDAEDHGVGFEVTGFLETDEFRRRIAGPGIPLAAHEHISASRSMLDWVEAGRRPLVVESDYAAEMARLRPGTIARYEPAELGRCLARAWAAPDETWLTPGVLLAPTLVDAAAQYRTWWDGMVAP